MEIRPYFGTRRTIFSPRAPRGQERQDDVKTFYSHIIKILALLAPWRSWREFRLRMPEQGYFSQHLLENQHLSFTMISATKKRI
jgi:hypothetical protein